MNNTARKIVPIEKYIGFDLINFEQEIRQDERRKQIERMKCKRNAAIGNILDYLFQKSVGFFLVVSILATCLSPMSYTQPGLNQPDGTLLVLFVPFGLYLMFTSKHIFRDNRFNDDKRFICVRAEKEKTK